MSKTQETLFLEKRLYATVIKRCVYGTFEVTLGWFGKERVDFITYDYKHIIRCYEIKTSLSDFHSSAKKSFVGHFNYYVMTNELWKKVATEIPAEIGVYVGNTENDREQYYDFNDDTETHWKPLTLVKKPKRQDLKIDKDIIMASMIRSLHRDAEKYNKLEEHLLNQQALETNHQQELKKLKYEAKNWKKLYQNLCFDIREIYGRDFFHSLMHKRFSDEYINSHYNKNGEQI